MAWMLPGTPNMSTAMWVTMLCLCAATAVGLWMLYSEMNTLRLQVRMTQQAVDEHDMVLHGQLNPGPGGAPATEGSASSAVAPATGPEALEEDADMAATACAAGTCAVGAGAMPEDMEKPSSSTVSVQDLPCDAGTYARLAEVPMDVDSSDDSESDEDLVMVGPAPVAPPQSLTSLASPASPMAAAESGPALAPAPDAVPVLSAAPTPAPVAAPAPAAAKPTKRRGGGGLKGSPLQIPLKE